MNKAILMRVMHRNKILITHLLDLQSVVKRIKREADENGNQDAEYSAHNQLKMIRAEVAKLSLEQKHFKALVSAKEVY